MDRAVDGFGMTSVVGARGLRGRASSRDGGDARRDAEETGGDCKAGGGDRNVLQQVLIRLRISAICA